MQLHRSLLSCLLMLTALCSPGLLQADDSVANNEAEQHFQQGWKALKHLKWDEAIEELEAALETDPENAHYHHVLGTAYIGQENHDAGWFHIRQAVLLDPDNEDATADFLQLWDKINHGGLLAIGAPLPLIIKTLGQPDLTLQQGPKQRLGYGFMSLNLIQGRLFSILDTRGLEDGKIPLPEFGLAFEPPEKGWRAGYRYYSTSEARTDYIFGREPLHRWTKMVSDRRLVGHADAGTAEDHALKLQETLSNEIPGAEVNILEILDEGQTVYLETMIPKSQIQPAEQTLVRMTIGGDDLHMIEYRQRVAEIDEDTRDSWLTVLREAKLTPREEQEKKHREQMVARQKQQLLQLCRHLIAQQIKSMEEQDITQVRSLFDKSLHAQIDQELMNEIQDLLQEQSLTDLVADVEIEEGANPPAIQIYQTNGEKLTRFLIIDGRWVSDTLWIASELNEKTTVR